jgi:isopentenyl-diphosphate Delta-isomerase
MSEEFFDVVDDRDQVLFQAPRSQVHARQWLHRAVHVFVFNSQGELLVHRRSAMKDEYPLRCTSSASGHVSAGESYEASAVRELAEELGLCCPLEFLQKFPASPDTCFEHTSLYRAVTDTPPEFEPTEIESGQFYQLTELSRWVAEHPEDFTPCFITLLNWYCDQVAVTPCLVTQPSA